MSGIAGDTGRGDAGGQARRDAFEHGDLVLRVGDLLVEIGDIGLGVVVEPVAALFAQVGELVLGFPRGVADLVAGLGHALRGARDVGHADPVDRGEQQEHREQEQRHRRHEFGALAVDVAAGEVPGMQREHRQRLPDPALEMEHAVRDVVAECCDIAVDVPALSAILAEAAAAHRAAIEAGAAGAVVRVVRRGAAAAAQPIDRAREDAAGQDVADAVRRLAHIDRSPRSRHRIVTKRRSGVEGVPIEGAFLVGARATWTSRCPSPTSHWALPMPTR